MLTLNRRDILRAGLFGLASGALPHWMSTARAANVTRSGAHTPQGKAMLAIYAEGVKAMMDTSKFPAADPRAWMFQWYTHAVPDNTSKEAELSRIYPSADPRRAIAEAMWDTCEAHTDSDRENFFLPWHRMFVLCFEQIIRSVTGRNDFALPYWDYTTPANGALPEEFRRPDDPQWQYLYRQTRIAAINQGRPLNLSDQALSAMKSAAYAGGPDDDGFCANLDFTLHGNVHVGVGNARGMGQVPWAAADPIFWLHHCNIDRIWASWNKAGGRNYADSQFLQEPFHFADDAGQEVTLKVADFMDMPGYGYDAYVERPDGSMPFSKPGPLFAAQHGTTAGVTPKIALGQAATTIRLARPTTAANGGPLPAAAPAIKSLPAESKLFLRLQGLASDSEPETTYDVYVNPKSPSRHARTDASFIGTINFFGAAHQHRGAHAAHAAPPKRGRSVSFVLTDKLRKALEQAGPALPSIVIVPVGKAAATAKPTIDKISLVSS